MSKPLELNPEYSPADRIDAPHRFAYKFAFKLYLRSVDGETDRPFFDDEACSLNAPLAWSADGSVLYHAYDQIYAIDPESRSSTAVTDFPERYSVNHHLYRSPDGRRLVFYRDTKLRHPFASGARRRPEWNANGVQAWYSIELDGSGIFEFPTLSESPLRSPEYFWWHAAKDERRCLLWKEDVASERSIRVWAMDAIGENRSLLATFPHISDFGCVPSPDGSLIAYGYRPGDESDTPREYAGLFLRSLPGDAEVLVSREGHHPAWSPRGDELAYLADSALWIYEPMRHRHAKIAAIPGPEPSQSIRFGGGFGGDSRLMPAWSPDGRFIAVWLHRQNRAIPAFPPGTVWSKDDFDDRHVLVDMEGKQVFNLVDGYWEHVAWQPQSA